MNPPPSPGSAARHSEARATPASQAAWEELLLLSRNDAADRSFLGKLAELWRSARGAAAVAVYVRKGTVLEREIAVGDHPFPPAFDEGGGEAGFAVVGLPDGALLFVPGPDEPAGLEAGGADALTLLLGESVRGCGLRRQLKEQSFQANYRGVELEALYDVGLKVAATLDREQLSEEILLRAVSLLDARRGALYLLEDGHYRLDRTFGGEAAPGFAIDDHELAGFLAGRERAPSALLPGARHCLGVPIAIEESPRGLLAVGDKESRRGVGPFPASDLRTLGLFANQAAIALENARLHLEALEKERLEREMSLAAEIQRQILPKGAPYVPGFDVAGWNRPARQVGGDYYDLLLLPGERVGLVVADVSGKGMPAALLVSTLHSALRLLPERDGIGPAFLERLNRHLVESSAANKFVTLLLAELQPETGRLQYLNAGHNPGLLLRRDGRIDQLGAGGLPLGLLPGARFQLQSVDVEPGDLLCLYSDGITECESPTEEEFGMARLIDVLAAGRHQPLPALIETIDDATCAFAQGKPQGDDQTVVLLRRHG